MTVRNLLAIVLVTRNEAAGIGRCAELALVEAARFPGTEIILVDSASTDSTIEIARKFPISIIQLQPHWPLTPGAGRYLGTLATSGEYVLFLDGDTELYPGWLPQALDFLCQHSEAAGVGGGLDEFYVDEQGVLTGAVRHRYQVQKPTQVRALGGNSLYRRSALDKAGTFHPYLALHEDTELGLRLRKAGYALWCLPVPMARHVSLPRDTFREALRRFRAGYYSRCGRTLRVAWKNGLAKQFVRESLMNYVVTGSYLLVGLASFIMMLIGEWEWLAAWLLSSLVIFVVYSARKRSPRKAFNAWVARLLVTYGLVAGFITGGQDASQYPTDAIVLQRQGK